MTARERIKYVLTETARRGLEIGKAHGDEVLGCLQKEFVGIKKGADGDHIFPRGVKAAIQLIYRHNNNGGAGRSAAAQISQFVDLVATRACGVKS